MAARSPGAVVRDRSVRTGIGRRQDGDPARPVASRSRIGRPGRSTGLGLRAGPGIRGPDAVGAPRRGDSRNRSLGPTARAACRRGAGGGPGPGSGPARTDTGHLRRRVGPGPGGPSARRSHRPPAGCGGPRRRVPHLREQHDGGRPGLPYSKHLVLPGRSQPCLLVGGAGGVVFSSLSVWLAGLAAMVLVHESIVGLCGRPLVNGAAHTPRLRRQPGRRNRTAAVGRFPGRGRLGPRRPVTRRLVPVAVLAFVVPMWRTEGMFAVAAVAVLATEPLVIAARSAGSMATPSCEWLPGWWRGPRDRRLRARRLHGCSLWVHHPDRAVHQDYDPIRGRLSSMWIAARRPRRTRLLRTWSPWSRCWCWSLWYWRAARASGSIVTPPSPRPPCRSRGPHPPALPLVRCRPLRCCSGPAPVGPQIWCPRRGRPVGERSHRFVVATSYLPGAVPRGGRYFHILIPLLVLASLVGLSRARDPLSGRDGWWPPWPSSSSPWRRRSSRFAVSQPARSSDGGGRPRRDRQRNGRPRTNRVPGRRRRRYRRGQRADLREIRMEPTPDGLRLLSVADLTRLSTPWTAWATPTSIGSWCWPRRRGAARRHHGD